MTIILFMLQFGGADECRSPEIRNANIALGIVLSPTHNVDTVLLILAIKVGGPWGGRCQIFLGPIADLNKSEQ